MLSVSRFDDCFKLGKRIDEKPYLLPDPEILRKHSHDDVKVPNTPQIEGATSPRPEFLPTPTDTPNVSIRKLHVFNAKKVMLAEDLVLGSRLRGILEDLIEKGGGKNQAKRAKKRAKKGAKKGYCEQPLCILVRQTRHPRG